MSITENNAIELANHRARSIGYKRKPHNNVFYCYLLHFFFFFFLFFFFLWLGEIGGNMGLFLGCSLMTIFEFADLLVALVFVRSLHKEYQT